MQYRWKSFAFVLFFFISLPSFYLHANIQLFHTIWYKDYSLSTELPLQSQLALQVCVYFWIFFSIPLTYLSIFMPVPLSVV